MGAKSLMHIPILAREFMFIPKCLRVWGLRGTSNTRIPDRGCIHGAAPHSAARLRGRSPGPKGRQGQHQMKIWGPKREVLYNGMGAGCRFGSAFAPRVLLGRLPSILEAV
jgi:hypothetical protein